MSDSDSPAPSVTVEQLAGVVVVHLDDGKANALSMDAIAAITRALEHAEADPSIGALVLHGREGRFSAGFDLGVMRGDDLSKIIELICAGGELVRRLYGSPLPIVAACTGHALAAGALLLLGCDVRVGADIDCKIGLNEVAIGMVLPDWALTIAKERLSRRHLQRAVANGVVTAAPGARDAGFLDEVVPEREVLGIAIDHARDLAALSGRAYAGTVLALRGAVLERMAAEITSDREKGSSPVD